MDARRALAVLVASAFALPSRAAPTTATGTPSSVRHAAQHGLDYLAQSATAWTATHNCFGCHVQGVTMEGLAVGRHNHYDVLPKDLQAMVQALNLGVTAGGPQTGAAFEGAAWARYDQWVDATQQKALLTYARTLMKAQAADGSVADDDTRKPVIAGTLQTTYLAMQTWRQTYARTADEVWLSPMRRAERYLVGASHGWDDTREVYLQDINYALLGLVAAGVGNGEPASARLQKLLTARQLHDGGWALDGAHSDPIATGETLYALKMAGHADQEPALTRGMSWLVEHQAKDGAWNQASNQGGADKGATMWAVLGLVTVDAVSVAVGGLTDGAHVLPQMALAVRAHDNQGRGVAKVELYVDDLLVKSAAGDKLDLSWTTSSLKDGKHVVEALAVGADGKESRARYEVYAGNVFLTQVGTRFDEARQLTEVGFRDIAPEKSPAKVALEVYAADDKAGEPVQGKKVFATAAAGVRGAMTFTWDGKDAAGKAQPKGRYFAVLAYQDAAGKVVQTERTLFFQDTETAQHQKYAEVEGQVSLRGAGSGNAKVELVDERGRVVQSTVSTAQGNYRFKNVDGGKYKVRVAKDGFRELSQDVAPAAAGAPARANMAW